MDNAKLIEVLWNSSNLIVGFAVAQTLAFAYKMADEKFADLIDNPRAKIIVSFAIVLSFVFYVFGFYRITERMVELEKCLLHDEIYHEAYWWRLVVVLPLLPANLAALFGRQILLGRWIFGWPRPTRIASVKPGPVTVVGTVKATGDGGVIRVEDRSGWIIVHAEDEVADLLARASTLDRPVLIKGRIDEQGRFTADAVR